jgi:(1->4)-alpha-D-glucan 1-alpha-D-glucosylmutase
MRAATEFAIGEVSGVSECLDRLAARKWQARPVSTYRFQLRRGFGFQQATELVAYLRALGVTHTYSSPILMARSGSPHGYDIIDHNSINPDLGTEDDLRRLSAELKHHGMGLVLDYVPNHMGVGTGTNPWWQDVLMNGRSSEYSGFFDIDWNPLRPDTRGKVLLPILGAPYGEVLERGELKLVYEDSRFSIVYFETRLPIDPQTIPLIFEPLREGREGAVHTREGQDIADLFAMINAFGNLPAHDTDDPEFAAQRNGEAPELYRRLEFMCRRSPLVGALVEDAVRLCNGRPGQPRSFDSLHRLLEAQAYRVAHWRVSAEEINYRRFFDINDLVGVRMENPQVFAETHRLLRRLLAEGIVDGLRIDHPDGMLNPAQYFTRLQMLYAASQCAGPEPHAPPAANGIETDIQQAFGEHDWIGQLPPMFVAVEKILEPGEQLPGEWAIDGTVGYDFLNLVNGIFIDQRNERAFTNLFRRFTGWTTEVSALIYACKKLVLNSAMAGELLVLTHLLAEISGTDRRARDFTRKALADAIRETIACFPVYRTYVDERGNISDRDRAYISEAVVRARRRNESMPAAVFHFLRDTLLLRLDARNPADTHRRALYFTLKFQQLTGPVMAKGLEDTACYAYNRLCSVNEVGGSPDQFGYPVDEFHRGNAIRAERWPASMLATSTHDTKRSEDVRARLNVLTEMPRTWSAHVLRWRRLNRSKKRVIGDGRSVPDANEEYLLYQTLVGVWPWVKSKPGAAAVTPVEKPAGKRRRRSAAAVADQPPEIVRRVQEYMTKAVHEAKMNLSWVNPNQEYVDALTDFIARLLDERHRDSGFLAQFESFAAPVQFFGAVNGLAQKLLTLTSPGTPDIYQGNEIWDFSLVDPDNRRTVDFALRRKMLDDLLARAETSDLAALCRELLARYTDGAIKMWITHRTLTFRAQYPELFHVQPYVPAYGAVEKQEHLVAFTRAAEKRMALVAVPRLAYTLMKGDMRWPTGEAWGNAELGLPPRAPSEFENVLTGEVLRATPARSLLCSELFATLPVALLSSR